MGKQEFPIHMVVREGHARGGPATVAGWGRPGSVALYL